MKTNYHTHHYLCNHANGDMTDYIEEAILKQYSEIGISDHGPLPNEPFPRMSIEAFKNVYLKEFRECKVKYQNKIKTFIGLEIEYIFGMDDYYHKLGEEVDYLILACHYYSGKPGYEMKSYYDCNTPEKLLEYTELVEKALDTKLFKILAHPDIYMLGYPDFDSLNEICVNRILDAAERNDVVIELNANGIRKGKIRNENGKMVYAYPYRKFWEIVKERKSRVVIGSDCHDPSQLDDMAMAEARKLADELKLNIIEKLSDEF